MGFNTTVVVLNDALGDIENDPNFGKNLARAIMRSSGLREGTQDVVAGCHGNAASVIESHHANFSTLILVGGNTGTVVQPGACGDDHDKGKEEALRRFADQMGFRLVKKSAAKA